MNSVNGLRFHGDCVFYAGGVRVRIFAGNGSRVGDVFFNPVLQMDGTSYKDFQMITASAPSQAGSVKVRGAWIAGSSNNQVEITANAIGKIDSIEFRGNWFKGGRKGSQRRQPAGPKIR